MFFDQLLGRILVNGCLYAYMSVLYLQPIFAKYIEIFAKNS